MSKINKEEDFKTERGFRKPPKNKKPPKNESTNTDASGKVLEQVEKRSVCKPGKYNDPTWYYRNEQDLKDNFSLSVGSPLGISSELIDNALTTPTHRVTIPGIAAYHVHLTPGFSNASTSALNLASFRIYSKIKTNVTSNLRYDPQNVMLYLLAMDSVHVAWLNLVRVYYALHTYSANNRYLPKTLVESMRCNFDDLLLNLSNFRAYLNLVAQKINSMFVPDVLSFFTRHQWLFNNLFADEDVQNAQIYLLVPETIFQYVESTESEEIGYLTSVQPPVGTFASIKSQMDSLIQPIIGSEDMNRIAGDLAKAYGEDHSFFLPVITDIGELELVKSSQVVSQLENADFVTLSSAIEVREDSSGSYLQCIPSVNSLVSYTQTNALWIRKLLNFHVDTISPSDVAEAVRFCASVNSANQTLDIVGSEIISKVHVYYTPNTSDYLYSNYVIIDPANVQSLDGLVRAIACSQGFDRFTILKLCKCTTSGSALENVSFLSFLGDIARYAYLDRQTLQQMHESALLAMFDDEKTKG